MAAASLSAQSTGCGSAAAAAPDARSGRRRGRPPAPRRACRCAAALRIRRDRSNRNRAARAGAVPAAARRRRPPDRPAHRRGARPAAPVRRMQAVGRPADVRGRDTAASTLGRADDQRRPQVAGAERRQRGQRLEFIAVGDKQVGLLQTVRGQAKIRRSRRRRARSRPRARPSASSGVKPSSRTAKGEFAGLRLCLDIRWCLGLHMRPRYLYQGSSLSFLLFNHRFAGFSFAAPSLSRRRRPLRIECAGVRINQYRIYIQLDHVWPLKNPHPTTANHPSAY